MKINKINQVNPIKTTYQPSQKNSEQPKKDDKKKDRSKQVELSSVAQRKPDLKMKQEAKINQMKK